MTRREISLAKGGHDYVFRYLPGEEDRILDEITRLARDAGTDLDLTDAATLGFQVAQNVAIDCCTAMMSPTQVEQRPLDSIGRSTRGDDAKDGPCTNTNFP